MKILISAICTCCLPVIVYSQQIQKKILDTSKRVAPLIEKVYPAKTIDTNKSITPFIEKVYPEKTVDKSAVIKNYDVAKVYYQDTTPRRTNIIIRDTVIKTIEVRRIRGTIKDSRGNPVPGATVKIKGTTRGYSTDQNGNFSMSINKGDKLDVQIIGYSNFEIDSELKNITIQGFNIQSSQSITSSQTSITKEASLNVFPVPYPVPSAIYNLPLNSLLRLRYFYQADSILSEALSRCSYDQKRYYFIPNGFALITQMEQIEEDGSSLNPPERWSSKLSNNYNDPIDYIRALFTSQKGYFRVLVFLFTDIDLSSNNNTISEQEARKWLNTGYTDLPNDLKRKTFSGNHRFTLLVYHYSKKQGTDGKMLTPSEISGQDHFIKSKLSGYIK